MLHGIEVGNDRCCRNSLSKHSTCGVAGLVGQYEEGEDRLGMVEGVMKECSDPAQALAGIVLRELKIEEHDQDQDRS